MHHSSKGAGVLHILDRRRSEVQHTTARARLRPPRMHHHHVCGNLKTAGTLLIAVDGARRRLQAKNIFCVDVVFALHKGHSLVSVLASVVAAHVSHMMAWPQGNRTELQVQLT